MPDVIELSEKCVVELLRICNGDEDLVEAATSAYLLTKARKFSNNHDLLVHMVDELSKANSLEELGIPLNTHTFDYWFEQFKTQVKRLYPGDLLKDPDYNWESIRQDWIANPLDDLIVRTLSFAQEDDDYFLRQAKMDK